MNVIKIAKSLSREEAKTYLNSFYGEAGIVRCNRTTCYNCKFLEEGDNKICIDSKIVKYAVKKMIIKQEAYNKFRKTLEDNYNRKIVVEFIRFDDEPLKLGYKNTYIDNDLRGKFMYNKGYYSLKSVNRPYLSSRTLYLRGINSTFDNDTLHIVFKTESELENYVINMNKLIKKVNKSKKKQEVDNE